MVYPLETDLYVYEHLLDSKNILEQIDDFAVNRESAKGLELYLKNLSIQEEQSNDSRTYIVKNRNTNEIAAFFSIKSGLFTLKGYKDFFYTVPAIELSNFAVNSNYQKKYSHEKRIGQCVFQNFVLPLIKHLQHLVGIKALYIFALPEKTLLEYYKTLGFNRLEKNEEEFVYIHVKPKYDDGCVFMYQVL